MGRNDTNRLTNYNSVHLPSPAQATKYHHCHPTCVHQSRSSPTLMDSNNQQKTLQRSLFAEQKTTTLELHGVGLVTVRQREGRGQVLGHDRALLLDGSQNRLVQSLLVLHLARRVRLLVGGVGKEGSLGLGTR